MRHFFSAFMLAMLSVFAITASSCSKEQLPIPEEITQITADQRIAAEDVGTVATPASGIKTIWDQIKGKRYYNAPFGECTPLALDCLDDLIIPGGIYTHLMSVTNSLEMNMFFDFEEGLLRDHPSFVEFMTVLAEATPQEQIAFGGVTVTESSPSQEVIIDVVRVNEGVIYIRFQRKVGPVESRMKELRPMIVPIRSAS